MPSTPEPLPHSALIVEENLGRTTGHYEPWIEGISGAFKKEGLAVTIIGSTQARALPGGHSIEPWLARGYLDTYLRARPGMIHRLVAALRHNSYLFLRLVAWFRGHPRYDLVMATQVNVFHLLAWRLIWMAFGGWKVRRLVLNSLVPMWLYEHDDKGAKKRHSGAPLVGFLYWLYRGAVLRGGVLLTAETEHDAREIQQASGVPVVTLPTPRPESLVAAARERIAKRRSSGRRPPVLGWLGRCSEEKGFSFFFEACRRFLITNPDTPCTILIQYLMSPEGCRITAAEVEQLAASDPRVRLVKEPASGSAFGHLLGELDCLVLPYLRRNYVGRNSSAALDAVLAGIPIITTEGTWMAELMGTVGSGLACRDQDASDLAACMKRAVESCPTLTAEAWERSSLARESVSWTRFSALIFSPQDRASADPSQNG